jgi:hypothetical protein
MEEVFKMDNDNKRPGELPTPVIVREPIYNSRIPLSQGYVTELTADQIYQMSQIARTHVMSGGVALVPAHQYRRQ